MNPATVTEFVIGGMTIVSSWMIGNKSVWGQRIAILANFAWWFYVIAFERWGLIPMEIFLTIVTVRNLIKWEKEASMGVKHG